MTYTEKIIDIATGLETIRPYTTEEIAAVEAERAAVEAERSILAAEIQAKIANRQAVLDKLGLTADEVTALLA
jgi:hypothetical protein